MAAWIWLACALQAVPVEVKVGDPAPAFELLDDAGKPWKSEDHVGKSIVVLYFYPASFTGGCTAQAKAFRDALKRFGEKGVEVVGVSGDAVKTQEAFKKVHELNFALLADEKGDVGTLFGVPVKKAPAVAKGRVDNVDQEFKRDVTISRWTFVIDRSGKVAYKNTKVNPGRDTAEVLDAIDRLR